MTGPQIQNTACANCMKSDSRYFCAGCKGSPNAEGKPQKTAYCDTFCQKSHWKVHKSACLASRQRKILFRAGDTAQKLFYMFRRELFDKSFRAVAHEGSDMILYDDVYENAEVLSYEETIEKCLMPFPDDIFIEKQDKEATLAYNACTDVLLFLHKPLSYMLEGKL